MFYRILADLVAFVHFAFIVFVIFGGLLALRWRWAPWVHAPAAVWGTGVELFGFFCPLTTLENSLRRVSGAAGYSGGFMEQYLLPLIYPDEITREIQMLLGAVLVVLNLVIYFVIWRRFRTRKVW
ncbi:MAG: DUF2784 domain-containing protein [Candidatus Thiodiazotropha sp. (ex Epidulcina cf. delphinae)]|nr:DUF2784 domain-containing protein [Candidatus Thiodiazotropha sp. (ex Epidulcina cf. delphinae)]